MTRRVTCLLALVLAVVPAAASVDDDEVAACAALDGEAERLACFDDLARRSAARGRSFLDAHWDLGDAASVLRPWPHRPTYVLPVRVSSDPNETPFRERAADPADPEPLDVQAVEAKFQISFKTKLWRRVLGGPGTLWFGYTQQSHFQVYNADASRPFRETDFEPEAVLVFPTRQPWGRFTWRLVGAGVNHQSNGRSEPLSRSWNRLYVVVAGEGERAALHLRAWTRIDDTDPSDDDNPGIEDYVGRLEAHVHWRLGRHVLSLRGRSNLDVHGHHGSLQADWFFPLGSRLKGQVQAFTGYGESLIDYNHEQTTLGVGFLLFDRP